MGRRTCLSLGVSEVKPGPNGVSGFPVLDGAIVAARCIGSWALAVGLPPSDIAVVTDERGSGPVTTERVRAAVSGLFPAGAETVDHLVLSFCGHGQTGAEVGSTFWLLSDALQEQYRVNVDLFVGELHKFGVQRITLISDACRDGPATLDLQRLEGRRVLVGPGVAVKSPRFDRLAACQDGTSAFMVGDPGSALPGKCIFSGVVADILWKREITAIPQDPVTTTGLGAAARDRATERAKDYLLELYPQCLVDPLPAILVGAGQELPPEKEPQDWPRVGEDRTPLQVQIDRLDISDTAATPDIALERLSAEPAFREEILGAKFGASMPDLDFSRRFSGFQKEDAGALFDLVKLRTLSQVGKIDLETRNLAEAHARQAILQLEAAAADRERQRVATQLRAEAREASSGWETSGATLVTRGIGVSQIYARRVFHFGRLGDLSDGSTLWRQFRKPRGETVLVETDDAVIIPVTLYRDLLAYVCPDPRGGYVVAYGLEYMPGSIERAFGAIADLASGRLTPLDLDRFAAELRLGKHLDPIRGVIAAYLYKAVADVDSIRRMAFFYHRHNQAVPFDIVLLGDMPVERLHDGRLLVSVPPVSERMERQDDLPDWVTQATYAAKAVVGGVAPWLSIGWDYISDPTPAWKALVEDLAPLSRDVARSGFTNLSIEAGRFLAERRHLLPQPPW